ncbi:hypothetical protein [Chelatococcus asaccharovorans]|uniref:Uncharacterized protein n=1 Tax=Chelatococcus asaccharovorans TaxID=28210 RepID=A0A2V3U3X8_9HYPH|nr:hypothetical protein [Chelatococcus asaccharovorans]MBS7702694.1 hypothetical protein [Chelatococcus asaccharovorans]PXW56988.1 hypothetical protein C7450_10725 [Chelatococcus asaccharovorans]
MSERIVCVDDDGVDELGNPYLYRVAPELIAQCGDRQIHPGKTCAG